MKTILQILTPLILFINSPLFLSPSQEINIHTNFAEISYPESIKFSLELSSSVEIKTVELVFGTDVITCGESKSIAIPEDYEATKDVSVEWEWFLRKSGALPPGTQIWWEWVLVDSNENSYTSPRQTISFIDESNPWEMYPSESIEIYYLEGTEIFASELSLAGEAALDSLYETTGVELAELARIYIYPNSEMMQTATLFAPDWSGGLAFSEYRTVLAGVPPDRLTWGREVVAHELTHVLIGVYTYSCVGGLPTWLSEGLAMYAEKSIGNKHLEESVRLETAITNNSLFSITEISNIFSNDPDLARQAYAQSLSVVQFLTENFGQEKMLEMLDGFKDGNTQDNVLGQVYDFDQNSLNAAWRDWIGASPSEGTPIPQTTPTRTPYPTIAPITGPSFVATSTQEIPPEVPTTSPTQAVETDVTQTEENPDTGFIAYGYIPIAFFFLGIILFIIRKIKSR